MYDSPVCTLRRRTLCFWSTICSLRFVTADSGANPSSSAAREHALQCSLMHLPGRYTCPLVLSSQQWGATRSCSSVQLLCHIALAVNSRICLCEVSTFCNGAGAHARAGQKGEGVPWPAHRTSSAHSATHVGGPSYGTLAVMRVRGEAQVLAMLSSKMVAQDL